MNKLKCELCDFSTTSYRGLTGHIVQKHSVQGKDYYDKYLKKPKEGICPTCGKQTRYISMTTGYLKHCSQKCSSLDKTVQEKLENTSKNKYGTRRPIQSKIVQDNLKHSFIEKYGVDNPAKSEQIKEKIKNTSIERYNGIGWASSELLAKCQQTNLKRYGAINGQGGIGLEKTKQTNIERYGVSNAAQSAEIRNKITNTKRKTGSMSKIELYFEQKLNELGILYDREYISKDYPYFCDFHFLDMYVELHCSWMHGGHWFDATNQADLDKLAFWKERSNKNTSQYKTAINVWTKSDIEKRNIAIKNHLNYIVLWNKTDIDNFLNILKENLCDKI